MRPCMRPTIPPMRDPALVPNAPFGAIGAASPDGIDDRGGFPPGGLRLKR
jgi:hypothetical protein